jgi:hypothetical protein
VSQPVEGEKGGKGGLFTSEPRSSVADSVDDVKLTLAAEELVVGKEAIETGHLRVTKQTHTREAVVTKLFLENERRLRRFQSADRFLKCRRSVKKEKQQSFQLWRKYSTLNAD